MRHDAPLRFRAASARRPRAARTPATLPLAAAAVVAALASPPLARARPRGAEAAPPIRIELRASAEVPDREVALGDVAVLTTVDLPTFTRLVALPLGRAPRAGEIVRVDRADLARWIRARTGIEAGQIAWSGPAATEVRSAVQEVRGERIAERASDALRSLLARDGARVEVTVPRAPRDVAVPRGAVELAVRPPSEGAVPAKRQTVWVDVRVDGRFVRTVTVDAEVAVFRPALVTSVEQRPGDVLERSRVAIREVDVSGRRAPPVDPAAPEPLRVRRSLPAGATVTRADVEPAPLVTRGQPATLRAGGGGVRLETRVEVLEDGRSGQLVRVRVPSSTGPVLARVTGPGTVEVRP